MKKLLAMVSGFVLAACQSYGSVGYEADWAEPRGLSAPAESPGDARVAVASGVELPAQAQDAAVAAGVAVVRQVVLDAALRLVVVSADEARELVHAAAKLVGGHLQESGARSIVVRVPAAHFEDVLAEVERLGEVVERNVRAEDVTEELFDLDLRIDNARRTRERLLSHLEKSDSLENTLKVEAEIMRLSEEIERLEGRKRFVASRVAMSTIRVDFNTPQAAPSRDTTRLDVPFEWITRLGDGLVAGTVERTPRKPMIFAAGPHFDAPPDFVKYHSTKTLVEALEPDGVRISVARHDNFDRASIGFWQRLARRSLVEHRAIAITEEIAVDENRALLVGTREVGRRRVGYMLLLLRSEERVLVFEAWGTQERFDELRAALETSARSLRR